MNTYNDELYICSIFQCEKAGNISTRNVKTFLETNKNQDVKVPPYFLERIKEEKRDILLSYEEFRTYATRSAYERKVSKRTNSLWISYVQFLIPPRKSEDLDGSRVEVDGEYEELYKRFKVPFVMILFSALDLTFFLTMNFQNGYGWLVYDFRKKKEIWRFFTYQFVHIGYLYYYTHTKEDKTSSLLILNFNILKIKF